MEQYFLLCLQTFICCMALIYGKPHQYFTCGEMPESQAAKEFGSQEQSFKATDRDDNDVYYCRKMFIGKTQVLEIALQSRFNSADYITITDCKNYHYRVQFRHDCDFQFLSEECVNICHINEECPSKSELCSKKLQYKLFYPELDFNPSREVLYNFNDTLRKKCNENEPNEPPPLTLCP